MLFLSNFLIGRYTENRRIYKKLNKSFPSTHIEIYKGSKKRIMNYKQIRGLEDGIIVKDIPNERSKTLQCPYRKSSRVKSSIFINVLRKSQSYRQPIWKQLWTRQLKPTGQSLANCDVLNTQNAGLVAFGYSRQTRELLSSKM